MKSKELFTVKFRNHTGQIKKFPSFARDGKSAEKNFRKFMKREGVAMNQIEIIEVEPGGIIAGREVTICAGKNVKL